MRLAPSRSKTPNPIPQDLLIRMPAIKDARVTLRPKSYRDSIIFHFETIGTQLQILNYKDLFEFSQNPTETCIVIQPNLSLKYSKDIIF